MALTETRQKKVLVVDDIKVDREWVGRILRKANFLVDFAEDGQQALQILSNGCDFDLVLLDVEMPGINGFEVCQAMRSDEKLKDLPVIFLTSYTKVENKVFGFTSGAQDYVTKPYSPKELLVRVNTHIQLKHKTDIIKGMNESLVEKNKSITDSINYAKYMQKAMLPSRELLNVLMADYFIFNKPKDIITGDFYWFKQFGDSLYFALADCTGHGVPAAFMSVLGIAMLNEITREHFSYTPNIILNELRRKIITSLHQNDNMMGNKDGMDVALCMLNVKSLVLNFAGANIPLFVMRKNASDGHYELIKRKPDRMPVGKHPNDSFGFTNHQMNLMEGDRIYLLSDGYVSQFGGKENKTFKFSKFNILLSEIQKYTMCEQVKVLEETFENWRGKNEQADDVLVMGLEIKKNKS
jgi:DNA-binding response OmpR family regulator